VLGAGPLPKSGKIANAGGLRTAQFLDEILANKSPKKIEMWTIENLENRSKKTKNQIGELRQNRGESGEVRHFSIDKNDEKLFSKIAAAMKRFSPEIVFGINSFPAFVAAKTVDQKTPFWADLNGWQMAELHIQAVASGKNNFLAAGFSREKEILKRADFLSVVSKSQKMATLGEMAAIGLLTAKNPNPEIEIIKNACRPLNSREKEIFFQKEKNHFFRGKTFPKNAFALLWIGGMNAWADEKTLFDALEMAFSKNKNLHFLMTGGILPGIDDAQFFHFQKKAKKSAFRNHFHFLGWIAAEKMPFLLAECDAGVNVDRKCPETETGARNRINEFLRFGIPIISTAGAEIVDEIAEKNAGIKTKSGDAKSLAAAFLQIADDKKCFEKMSEKARKMAENHFSIEKTTAPIKNFLQNPRRIEKIIATQNLFSAGILYLKTRGIKSFFKKCRQKFSEKTGF